MDKTITEVVHETAKGLYEASLMDRTTMRKFNALCLPKLKDFTPRQIKKLRLNAGISQPVFAKMLNVSSSCIKHWETGDKHPSGTALKLLNLVAAKGIDVLCVSEEARK